MGKALKTVGAVIGAAALIATGAGAILMPGMAGTTTLFGVSVGTLNTVSAGLMAVGGMLDKPESMGSGTPDEWNSNPDQPTPFAFGRVGCSGKIVHRDEYGKDNKLQGIVSVYSGAGPIKSFVSYKVNDLPVSFTSNGGTAIGKYNRQMWRSWRLGEQPDTALSLPTGLDEGAVMPAWGPAYKLSGKACELLTVQQDSKFSVYPMGLPTPQAVIEGVYGYDPRYDSTYPGGFGDCRLGVRSTYRWINNPIIAGLNWALGMVENGHVVGGIGASPQGIDMPAFVDAANVSDANGWTVSAWPDTSEDVSQVLKQFLQAGGASYARHAGKISCVSRGAAKPSIVTVTGRDTCGPIELDTGASLYNRINTITPSFMSEAHGWKHVPADPVTFEALRTEDGGKRGDQITYRFADNVRQAGQLAAYDILDAREPFSGTVPFKPHLRRLKRGDCFVLDEPGFLLDGVKCIVLGRSYNAQIGEVRVSFRSETDGKHPLALGKTTTMPEYPVLTPADPTLVSPPLPEDWVLIPKLPNETGVQVPIIDIVGEVSNSTATAVHFEWTYDNNGVPSADWISAGIWPPTVKSISVPADPGTWIWIGASYLRGENFSNRQVYGPAQVPSLTAGNVIPTAPVIVGLQDQITTAFGDIFDVSNVVAEARNDLDAVEAEIAAARGGEGSLSARVAAVNQARIDGDTANASAISGVAARTSATEADIIDLENAQVGESLARAEQVNQLSARIAGAGTAGAVSPDATGSQFTPSMLGQPAQAAGWGSATYPLTQTVTVNGANVLRTTSAGTADINYTVLRPIFTLVQGRVYELRTDYTLAGTATNVEHIRAILRPVTALGAGTSDGLVSAGSQAGLGRRTLVQRFSAGVATAGAVTVPATVSHVRAGIRGPMTAGQTSASVAGYILDVHSMEWVDVTDEVALSASVTEHTLAIIDLENNLAGAGFRKIAEAAGGAPAYYEFFSSNTGGYAAIAAPVVALVNTSVGGDPVVAMELVDGKARFYGDLSVQSGTSGERTVITTNAIRVFDANNVERVTLGRW